MRVLELGNYVVPAYAGMILAEQGHQVTKWTNGKDPILGLNHGQALWQWINHRKTIENIHPQVLPDYWPEWRPDIVLDNFLPETLAKWEVDPRELALAYRVRWVSMRSDTGGRSFDIIAQARSWMEYAPWVPFWAGDTIGGLWLAFKALADSASGHFILEQGGCLQKLVEGELMIDVPRIMGQIPWENEPYRFEDGHAVVQYKGETFKEPVRDRAWKLKNLRHKDGRIII